MDTLHFRINFMPNLKLTTYFESCKKRTNGIMF